MHEQIVAWYLQRDADDQAVLGDIRTRYRLRPAADRAGILAQLSPEDAASLEEVFSHRPLSAEAAGFDVPAMIALTTQPEGTWPPSA